MLWLYRIGWMMRVRLTRHCMEMCLSPKERMPIESISRGNWRYWLQPMWLREDLIFQTLIWWYRWNHPIILNPTFIDLVGQQGKGNKDAVLPCILLPLKDISKILREKQRSNSKDYVCRTFSANQSQVKEGATKKLKEDGTKEVKEDGTKEVKEDGTKTKIETTTTSMMSRSNYTWSTFLETSRMGRSEITSRTKRWTSNRWRCWKTKMVIRRGVLLLSSVRRVTKRDACSWTVNCGRTIVWV